MIKLENVAVLNVNRYFYSKDPCFYSKIKLMKQEEYAFLEKYNIRNFKELEDAILKNIEVPSYFIELYKLVKVEIENYSLEKPRIYRTKYDGYLALDKESVLKTETETKCSSLLLENFLSQAYPSTLFKLIKKLSIEELRYLLLHTAPNGFNSLTMFPYINEESLKIMMKSLSFFENQLVRQTHDEDSENVNLFLLNYEEKRRIVEEELNSFLEYFLNMSDIKSFVWGNKVNEGNEIFTRIVENNTRIRHLRRYLNIKEMLINTLTNYMTLEELENGAIENHTLDRFILEKLPSKSVK